ncbi:MarR family winged helix-turn-helix transcriptional regulator [Kribbella sp. GL6]|uniref:MarR family winged helix-turn-helix transcriptional regulator n=1 Tax=Kribbella sp. GL6 TaxID=3419765 RepID=UPI003CFC3213
MPGPRLELAALTTQVAREIRTVLDQRLGEHGLTSQQAGVLLHVSGGTTSPRKLAELLGTDTAGMTRLLDRLGEKGHITRHPDPTDRRAITVELTRSGRKLLPVIQPAFEQTAATATAGISDADIRVAATVLGHILTTLAPARSS